MSRSTAPRCRRSASSSIRAPCSNTASAWRMCAPRSAPPMPTAPRATSSSRARAFQVYANDNAIAGQRLQDPDHRLSQRLGGAAVGRGRCLGRGGECPQSRHLQRQARHPGQYHQAARRQCHPGGGPHPSQLPRAAGRAAGQHQSGHPDRHHHLDPQFGARCGDDADPFHHPGDPGGVPVPAQFQGDPGADASACRCRCWARSG